MDNTKYKVVGMTCVACSTAIENKVRKLDGVLDANVNLVKEELNIKYDSKKVNYQILKKTLKSLGYDLTTENTKKENNFKIVITLILSFLVFYLAMTHMFKELKLPIFDIVNHHTNSVNFALAEAILTLIVMFIGKDFFIKGFKGLINKTPSMDTLIAIGTGSAFIYSVYSTYKIIIGDLSFMDHLYYETAAVIIALVMLGKYLEKSSKRKTNDAISKLLNLVPDTALVLVDGSFTIIKTELVKLGDICLVKPGTKIPVDGIVSEGETYIDESFITGESMPVKKSINDNVIGGSINGNGAITIKATAIGEDSMIAKIVKLVEDASMNKAPIAKMADTISSYFVPIIIVIAFLSAITWLLVGKDFTFAFTIFVAILVIACPCALGLATPVAIITATGKGASKGILIKTGEALEIMHKAKIVVLDKTGTITVGKPVLEDIITDSNKEELIRFVASLEALSEHPIASAITSYAKEQSIELLEVTNFKALPGFGISADIDNKKVIVGNYKYLVNENIKADEYNIKTSKTVLYVAIDNEFKGIITVSDKIKDTSIEAIAKLLKMGIRVFMLTGDNINTANEIAKEVGIKDVIAEVLPQDKYLKVKELQQTNKVIMVGDGINDAPALVQANVGVAIGTGTDIAIESADVILIKGDLNDLVSSIKLSHFTITNIKQNLFWAFIYNIIGIPFAMGIFYIFGGPLLNPVIAGLAMAFSSLSVVLNALRLKKKKI